MHKNNRRKPVEKARLELFLEGPGLSHVLVCRLMSVPTLQERKPLFSQ